MAHRWGHSGYKELYPEEFSDEPVKGTAKQQDRHSKKRYHESSDSDTVDVTSRRRHGNLPCKEPVSEKPKKHKKSKHKDGSPLVRNNREKSPKAKEHSPEKIRKSVKDRSSKVFSESKKLSIIVVSSVGTKRLPKSLVKSWLAPMNSGTESLHGAMMTDFSSTR